MSHRGNHLEPWRLLTTWDASPTFNMGLDEVLLEDTHAPPSLRFYTWSPDTLSLGYFQRFADVPATDRAGAVVRRMTGGGAIHHTNELTFSFTCSADHPLYRGPIADSYVRVHRAIAAGLRDQGVEADLRGSTRVASDRTGTGMCFHESTALDLIWHGRKGVGSAQRRRGQRVLHHGSIKLGSSALEGDIACAGTDRPELTPEHLAGELLAAFREQLDLELEAGQLTSLELAEAERRGAAFVAPDFLHRR